MNQKQRKTMILVTVIALAIIVITAYFGIKLVQRSKRLEPELARAMTYDQVKEGEEKTNSDFVEFDAFFLRDLNGDGYAESIRGTCREVGKEDTLYMELNVLTKGILKDAQITINSDKNYYLQTAIVKDNEIKENYIGIDTKTIQFKELASGTQKLLTAIVRSGDYSYESQKTAAIGNKLENYSKINSITLTGTHVQTNEDGSVIETPIKKTVKFHVDWYGTTNAEIKEIEKEEIVTQIEEKGEVKVQFTITTKETNNQLNLKKSYVEGIIPKLNGYSASKVEVKGTNVTYNYDEATGKFTAQSEAQVNEKQIVTKIANSSIDNLMKRINQYELMITYPLEAYETLGNDTFEIKVPIKAYYEGYNNTNNEFQNPYQSNIAEYTYIIPFENHNGDLATFEVSVGKYIYNQGARYVVSKEKPLRLYNGISSEEKNDTYIVRWSGYTGRNEEMGKMIMKESKKEGEKVADQFVKSDSSEESMKEVSNFVGIYFSNPTSLLGKNGEIKVYNDETGEVLATFNANNWNQYSESNPYQYEEPVTHIRVETSQVNPLSSITIYHVKELDDEKITKTYTEEEFKNLKYIKSTVTGYIGESEINTDIHTAMYVEPMSIATLTLSQTAISTQETQKNFEIEVKVEADENNNETKWINGTFLLVLPKDIIDLEINEITIDNKAVTITSYEQYEENGIRFIKVNTENEKEAVYSIRINCNITSDPRIPTTNDVVELYAYNENNPNYYYVSEDIYDVNNNLNREEKVNKRVASLSLISPNSLLTAQIASDYDTKGSVAVAPQVAIISKEQKTARITIELNNNYDNSVSEIKILGKIPFAGNSYIINGNDMDSTFTATMSKEGIVLPQALQGRAKVYYSTKENVNKEIADSNNGWTLTPDDMSKIKSYLVDLGDITVAKNEKHEISYQINLPDGLNYNQISYSHHAIYFSLDTVEGKYRTQTEANKLGIRIAKQYDLELIKYQKENSKLVAGATYYIQEEGIEESKTRGTGANGAFILKNLYIDKIYTIKEIKSPTEYELNEEEIKFVVREENGQLKVEKISGNVKNIVGLQNTEQEDYKVQIQVEDEVKANLTISKIEKGTINKLSNVKYRLTGKGLIETGKILTTNNNGEANIKGLYIGEEYTLEEIKSEGYYLASPIKFIINNEEGEYKVNLSGTVKANEITNKEEIPTLELEIENEKIPTYQITLKKYAKGQETVLKGAKYKIEGEGIQGGKQIYETDENGSITISNLYEYKKEKEITGIYTITEIIPPEGYSLNSNPLQFKAERNEEGILEIIVINGKPLRNVNEKQDIIINNAETEDAVIQIGLEDEPLFKLTKIDKTTGNVLPNTKFQLIEIDENYHDIDYAKDINGNYVGERKTETEAPVITTDENGVISYGLKAGLYKAVEIESAEGYELPKEIEDRTYYFGIETKKEEVKEYQTTSGNNIGGISNIENICATRDGSYLAVGYFGGSITLSNGEDVTSKGSYDGLIVKYNANGEMEWFDSIGGSDEDYIKGASQTEDGGYLVGGYFRSETITLSNNETVSRKSNNLDGLIIKYDVNGRIEWWQNFGKINDNAYIEAICSTADGGYIIGGSVGDTNLTFPGGVMTIVGDYYGIIKYNAKGEKEWASRIAQGNGGNRIKSICQTADGGYLAGGYLKTETLQLPNGDILKNQGSSDGVIIKYDSKGNIEWSDSIGGTGADYIESVCQMVDGTYLVGGYFENEISLSNQEKVTSKGLVDGIVIQYDKEGKIKNKDTIGGEKQDYIKSVCATADAGYIIGGEFYSSLITLSNGKNVFNHATSMTDGLIVKYDANGEIEWVNTINGEKSESIKNIYQTADGNYLIGGKSNSKAITSNGKVLDRKDNDTGIVIKIEGIVVEPEIQARQTITVENSLKQYKITTEVEEINGIKGGTISGEEEEVYEIVDYGKSSTKEIKVIPKEGYKVERITINGEEIPFVVANDYTVTLELFENMTEDKQIVVKLSNTISHIVVHHYIKDTTTSVADDETMIGTIGKNYTTMPKVDLKQYELMKDENGEYVIPNNATGTFQSEIQEVIYYYEPKQIPITVRHYIEGTEEQVPLNDGTMAPEITEKGVEGQAYTTSSMENRLSPKYELVEVPENSTGTLQYAEVIVTYYYRIKQFSITTRAEGEGGSISGQEEKVYETVEYGEDSSKDITVTPKDGYMIESITVNGEKVDYVENENGTVTLENIKEVTENKEVVATFKKIPANVIVHYYIEGTERKVPSKTGEVVEDIYKEGTVNDIYVTKPSEEVSRSYELVATPENASGEMTKETIEVIYYYRLITEEIMVSKTWNHTNNIYEIPQKVIAELKNGETVVAEQELSEANNWSYTFTGLTKYDVEGNEIDYQLGEREAVAGDLKYYKAEINNEAKTITNTYIGPIIKSQKTIETENGETYVIEGEEITYIITVENAGGLAKDVVIKDSISEGVSFVEDSITLNGISTSNTQEDLSNGLIVNVPEKVGETNGKATISFKVKVNALPEGTLEKSITNTAIVDGENTNTTTMTVNKPQLNFRKASNPESGTLVKAGDKIAYAIEVENTGTAPAEVTIKDSIPTGTTYVNNSFTIDRNSLIETYGRSYTIEDLNNGIVEYIGAQEKVTIKFEVIVNDLENGAQIRNVATVNDVETNETVTIYVEPVISSEKTMTTENGLSYVVEGEEITYTITVENAGGLAKEVVVKDNVPEGTSFVEGSIQLNGANASNTQEDLSNGLIVNVPEKVGETNGKVTVSFKVKVNTLPEGTLEKSIANTAIVDGKETNTTTMPVNKAKLSFKKVSTPEEGSVVKAGDKITYTIEAENSGTAPTQVTIKDSVPTGTSYVEESLVVNRTMLRSSANYTMEELANGITLDLLAQEKVSITFEVVVNDLENGAQIKNVAMVNDMETNENVHEYVEAIVSQSKSTKTENGLDYVVAGEKITYTMQVNNHGGLAKEVVVKDSIPEGTTFVESSIKVNGTSTRNTKEDLMNGIKVTVSEMEDGLPGYASVSFDVTVNEKVTGDIKNTATVDNSSTNETKLPVVTYEKVAVTSTGENAVTVGDTITYKVRVHNTGTVAVRNITVKDTIPEGTKLLEIGDNGQKEQKEITWVIDEIAGGETKEVGFNAQVEYAKEEYSITNVATVNGKETNKTETSYEKPEPELTSKVEKIGVDKVTSKDTTVYYELKFTATVNDFVGKAKVTMVDTLPYEIDESKSKLNGGVYDSSARTITWVDEIENIHTFNAKEAKEIAITKVLELSYQYGNLDNIAGSMQNKVTTKIELQEPKIDKPTEYETVKEESKEETKETELAIPAEVVVHHYFYDAETKLPTTTKLANDNKVTGNVGQAYTTSPSSEVKANYVCVNETPEKHEGKMTENTIEVIYYYSLKTPAITDTIQKTATANKVVEETITNEETGEEIKTQYPVLTKEDDYVTYNITYKANIENYIGKAVVEIVDTVPAKIDTEKSDLNGGEYNEATKTITWKVEVQNINTYANGIYKIDFAKQIKLVYVEQNVNRDLVNTVTGSAKVYYPEEHPTKGDKEQVEEKETDEVTVKQDYKVSLTVEKVWEDNNNLKGKRPESVEITIKEMLKGEVTTEVLNKANNWTCIVENLPKYDEQTGRKLNYVVTENEVNKGDLEYYENPVITQLETDTSYKYTVKNSYKLLDTDLHTQITKNGTEEITASAQPVDYTIHLTAEIANYIGKGKVIIVDSLPYEIDEAKSNLNGGRYNAEDNTITWEEELPHINTEVSKENYLVDVTKQISVVYKNLSSEIENAKIDKITNSVSGKVELYETDEKEVQETTVDTKVNITGKVIVRYVDKLTGKDIIVKMQDEEGNLVDGTYNYEINGKAGEDYKTEVKDIKNYKYVESTNNETGIIREQEQEVIYYYETEKAQVIVKYQDKAGNSLAEDEIIEGRIDEPYGTTAKEIENYKLTIIPDNKEGTMQKNAITVIYIYERIPAKVIVKYLEKDTEKVLAPEDSIEGYVADKYETQRKAIANYRKAEPEPDNANGIMKIVEETNNTITVIYYYERIPSGIVTVKYVEEDTKEEITYQDQETGENKTYRQEIKGYVGDKYHTEEKEIPYYNLVKVPSNKEGTLEESGDTVIYYYSKQKFNIEMTKEINKVVMNGEEKKVNDGKLTKIEIVESKIPTTELEVTYSIKVRNTEELAGTAKVLEIIPKGYTVSSKTPGYWTINAEGNLETTIELKPGEEKTLEVVLRWNNSSDNFGEAQNTAKIIDTTNEANYEETSKEDNISSASIITSVKTGNNKSVIMIVICTMVSITLFVLVYVYEAQSKKRKIAIRMIKLEGKDMVIRKEKWQDKK